MPAAAPRSLADQLRGWSDQQVVDLLTRRPDLAVPAPRDSSQLASRAATRASVQQALDELTVLELTVLDAVNACGGSVPLDTLRVRVHADGEAVDSAVARLRAEALLWGEAEQLRSLSVLADILGTRVSGLGPAAVELLADYPPVRLLTLARDLGLAPTGDVTSDADAVTELLSRPAEVDRLVTEVDPPARAILEHLARTGKHGSVESTDPASERGAPGPVQQLLARGLLLARDRRHVAVPREVAIVLRGGHTTGRRVDELPPVATGVRDARLVDRVAAGAAFELVRHVELLLEQWGRQPPPVLRAGGLGVRELRSAAALLHQDEDVTALHVETASAAGLLAPGTTRGGDPGWLPTDAFDLWQAGAVAERWARLVTCWLDQPRLTGLVGGREEEQAETAAGGRPGRVVNALGPGLERPWLPGTRRAALAEVAALPAGVVLATEGGVASVLARLAWLRPRRPAARGQAVRWALREADVVGLTALGGMSGHGRAMLAAEDPGRRAAAALVPLLPEPVDHVLVQADLTAVAPGPLEADLARRLAGVADVESRGGATVYRFTTSSVRRAFDSGWSAGEVHDFVASASKTPVPQPLTYLVDDVSRRFGTLRVGGCEAFLRSDDEAALAELLHHPAAQSLRLRRIAPTVMVTDVPVDDLVPRLRELGAVPVVEGPDGTVRVARPTAQRTRTPRSPGTAGTPSPGTGPGATGPGGGGPRIPGGSERAPTVIRAAVGAIRAGDRAAATRPTTLTPPAGPKSQGSTGAIGSTASTGSAATPAATLAVLREAVESHASVWLRYVDSHGATLERVVDPVRVEAGRLTAHDHRSEDVRAFAVHRITGVRTLPVATAENAHDLREG